MALYKRGGVWWIDYTTPAGQRIRRSAATTDRRQAQEYHDRERAEAWRVAKLGEQPGYKWEDAVVRWCRETEHKASRRDDILKLRWLDAHLAGQRLDRISRDHIQRIAEIKRAESSAATANRYLALIRAILRRAEREWEWIPRAPTLRLYKESARRIRWLTRDQAERLLAELPPHLAAMARFSLATGLRQSNVSYLRWDQVDLAAHHAWVHPDEAKARRAIPVPLNDEAMRVLRGQVGQHHEWVFVYRGEPVARTSTRAWAHAVQRAGLEDFRWHDLRHTWASWHIQAGTPLHVLQELGGWETPAMVRRYAHLAPSHLADHAGRISGHDTTTSQPKLRVIK